MGSVTYDIYVNMAHRTIHPARLKVDNRRAGILLEGKNLIVKSRWRWRKTRRIIRLEPIFRLNEESRFELIGVFCPIADLVDLPARFVA